MKAELTNENKAKFFALYWGQLIGLDQEKGDKPCYVLAGNNIQYAEAIELKPLSQISDEDAIEVAKIINKAAFNDIHIERVCHVCVWFENARVLIYPDFSFTSYSEQIQTGNHFSGNGSNQLWVSHESILHMEHYLRSRGYALPWMGLSVEEMIEAGWIRLLEENESLKT